ncbi:MAG: cytochrome c maturation protein CcmE [Pseudomonadales bacterium]|nr:cytochrome c maturation protein CcmE [Pseudomonadales bacterium]
MKSHRRNRLLLVLLAIAGTGTAVGLVLMALNKNINLFYAPAEIVAGNAPVGETIRAGGMVVNGSVKRGKDLDVSFVISDLKSSEVTVRYSGILPDLFREGQGVIARGVLRDDGVFVADEVLAKHDEKYMPPEVADVLADAHKDKPQAGKTL